MRLAQWLEKKETRGGGFLFGLTVTGPLFRYEFRRGGGKGDKWHIT